MAMQFEPQIADILKNAETYHRTYYEAKRFGGPSLHFHQRALATRNPNVTEQHLEYVYATLASWGMHRMGKGGPKMQNFDIFCKSVAPLRDRIAQAQEFTLSAMTDHDWNTLWEIFRGIKIMATSTSLVGNSKAMHHMVPNVVPPIDREYTLKCLRGSKDIKNDSEAEWTLLQDIVSDFFAPLAGDKAFTEMATAWMERQGRFPWDTSILKVIDNLVIGSQIAAQVKAR
ncbi:MAG: hypothetical protein J7M19_00665 [Planctomycetes bacterium]|nr:hypothetical protein [Planctomycetota bacterium]